MHHLFHKKGLWIFLPILTLLIVSTVVILTVVSTATPEPEFDDFGYQTPNDYDMTDASTTLRFVFTVPRNKSGSYSAAGFAFSKSNDAPTVGGANCGTANATAVYDAISADGKIVDAPDGRCWVAVKLTNIPESYFDGAIYVRPFVTDGEGTRYASAGQISVWRANSDEKKWTSSSSSDCYGEPFTYAGLLSGGKHFYPDASNDFTGNDLLIEYSILWNETLTNLPNSRLHSGARGTDGSYAYTWMSFTTSTANDDCPFPGGFETCCRMNTVEYGPANMTRSKQGYSDYPNIGGSDQENQEFGWHRVGVRLHQELTNEDDVKAGADAKYKMYSTVYIDGVKLFTLSYSGTGSTNSGRFGSNMQYGLFRAENDGKGNVTYRDAADRTEYGWLVRIAGDMATMGANAAYLVTSDFSVSCGTAFRQQVTKVATPAARNYTAADGTTIPAKRYFAASDAHAHDWDEDYTVTKEATLLYDGVKVDRCSVCGQAHAVSFEYDPYVFDGTDASAPSGWGSGTNFFQGRKELSTLAGEKGSFYPTDDNPEGNDLLVEFSLLWNSTLNLGSSSSTFALVRFDKKGGSPADTTAWLHLGTGDHWCPFLGGIELGIGDGGTVTFGPESPDNGNYSDYSHIGDYGWHRVGVRLHQDATIVDDSVVYTLTSTIYVDGERVNEVRLGSGRNVADGYLLFEATIDPEDPSKLNYTDNTQSNKHFTWLRADSFFGSGSAKWLVLGDYYITSGHDFVQRVAPNDNPVAKTVTLGGVDYPASVYYVEDHDYGEDPLITVVPSALADGVKTYYCVDCLAEKNVAYTYAEYSSDVAAAQANNAFSDSAFGGSSYTKMSTSAYSDPAAYPIADQHPRLLFNASDLAAIRAQFADPDNIGYINSVLSNANEYDTVSLGAATVHASSDRYGPKGTHNCNEALLRCITAKAFLYQLTGAETYGYDAIWMIKAYISQLSISKINDQERYFGYTMFVAALVYDWCNDLLTASDKTQLISGVEHKLCDGTNAEGLYMEVGFPPSRQGAVSGHGAERQILRDYLSFALAVYDDEPTWYDFIGGRFYQEYVPVRNEIYKSGSSPQGISNYLPLRFTSDLWSAWLIKSATGTMPYNAGNMAKVATTYFSYVAKGQSNDLNKIVTFEEGDDELRSDKENLKQFAFGAMVSGYLFNDDTAMCWADFLDYSYSDNVCYFILKTSPAKADGSARYDKMDLILYNGGYLGQIIAHSSWEQWDTISVMMKIGNRTTSGHDHADSGSFQIYYRGLLTGDSGVYDSWESDHHKYYHRATIAHNSIVLQNGGTLYQQPRPNEPGDLSVWSSSAYTRATTTGYDYGYADREKTEPTFAYIAGDIAAGYNINSTVLDRLDRRMLAVYDTGNSDVVLYFFVYDYVTARNASYKKVFLLHTVEEPSISGNTLTVDNTRSKLVVQNAVGDCTITKSAGYVVGNTNYAPEKSDGFWGRAEIAPATGNKTDVMLNVMYVCNSDDDPEGQTASKISTATVTGSVIGKVAAIFVDAATRRDTVFDFTATSSEPTLTYYVSGVHAGKWQIVNSSNEVIGAATATEEGGLLTFTAPSGYIKLRPAF